MAPPFLLSLEQSCFWRRRPVCDRYEYSWSLLYSITIFLQHSNRLIGTRTTHSTQGRNLDIDPLRRLSPCHRIRMSPHDVGHWTFGPDHNVTMWRWTFEWSISNMIPQIKICSNCRKPEVPDRSANCYQGMLIRWRVPTSNILQSFNQIENGSKDCSRSKQLQEMEGELNSNKQYEIMKIEK